MTIKVTVPLFAMMLSLTTGSLAGAAPVCGDVNESSSITSTDALLVLKKSVNQPITLDCSAYDAQYSTCQQSLTTCQNAPECGDGVVEAGEDCEGGKLQSATCKTEGFDGGKLACGAGCTFDTSGCYEDRYDASGPTIIDHETGLEWEKKQPSTGDPEYHKPQETQISYSWCVPGPVYPDCLNPNEPFDGTAATQLLARLNGGADGVCYAGHCDWRLPTIDELETIFSPDGCTEAPCPADEVFLPMSTSAHWSSTVRLPAGTNYVWGVIPDSGLRGAYFRRSELAVRAVRNAG